MPKHLGRNRNKYIANKRAKTIKRKKWHEKVNLSSWVSAIATVVTAIFIFWQLKISEYQSNIFDAQTEILDKQTLLIQKQNELFEEQNIKIDSQNVLFGRQNELVNFQNSRTDAQNLLIGSQNELLDFQNSRISQQTNLQEAERRSAIVYLFSNVLDKIDEELKERELAGENRTLSIELIARIASLTQALKPYKYLSNDTIISRAVSPEKGQLLSALINFNLDQSTYDSIFKKSNFQNLELQHAYLAPTIFNKVDLANSVFFNCTLSNCKFNESNLKNVILNFSDISNTTFNSSNLIESKISGVQGHNSQFIGCSLEDINFSGSNLQNSTFDSTQNLELEFGKILYGQLGNSSQNLEKLNTFKDFQLIIGTSSTYQNVNDKRRFYHITISKINEIKESFNFSLSKMKKVDFSYVNLTGSTFSNYNINETNFNESTLTSTSFYNITVWKTYFNKVKLDSKTFEKNFNFQINSKIAPIGVYYELIPHSSTPPVTLEVVGGTINSTKQKGPYSHILSLKTQY